MEKIYIYEMDNRDVYITTDDNDQITLKTEREKKSFFDKLSKERIRQVGYDRKKDSLNIEYEDFDVTVKKYRTQKNRKYFESINDKINLYNKRKINKKMKLIKQNIIVGSLIATTTIGAFIASNINISNAVDKLEEEKEIVLELEEEEKEILVEFKPKVESEKKQIEENVTVEYKQPQQNNEYVTYLSTNIIKQKDNTSFEFLKECNDYDEVIKFAAGLYSIEYEKALEIIKNNLDYINGPKGQMSLYMNANKELDRIKDLKEKGVINPDIMVSGIFITLKNHAYDNKESSNIQTTDKTSEELEQEIVNAAKYIYGVEDEELLSTILSVHRLETQRGTSDLCRNKNNMGGVRKADLSFESFATYQLGTESLVRNILKNYDRIYYDDKTTANDSLIYRIAVNYCETPEDWAREVQELKNEITQNNELDKYLKTDNIKVH